MDAALIQQCADPSLKPAVIEQFIDQAGSSDPLAVTVKSGKQLILVPRPKSADEAMSIVRQYAGRAVVRVGLTQYPAGLGVTQVSEIDDGLVDPCLNLRNGTAMFAKIMRIVAKSHGTTVSDDALPQIFDDAIAAWQTGEFDGIGVFQAADPQLPRGARVEMPNVEEPVTGTAIEDTEAETEPAVVTAPVHEKQPEQNPRDAGIRINLSHIGVSQP